MNTEMALRNRAIRLGRKLHIPQLLGVEIFIAGNSLNWGELPDIDLFSPRKWPEDIMESVRKNCHIVNDTSNALTVQVDGTTVQLCRYTKDSLSDLVDSFDFAHIQVGVSGYLTQLIGTGRICFAAKEVYYTQAWEKANALHTTWFTGSDFRSPITTRIYA